MPTLPSPAKLKSSAQNLLRKPLCKILLLTIFCSFSYFIGSYTNSPYSSISHSTARLEDTNCDFQVKKSSLNTSHKGVQESLNFEPKHALVLPLEDTPESQHLPYPPCPKNYTNYCPCQDHNKERLFSAERRFHKERHCPEKGENLRCLVPKPAGYKRPFSWPMSRDYAWFKNVPFKSLIEYKKTQNWVRLEGARLFFPGGGTSFPQGVKGYIDQLKRVVPLNAGAIRTVLDVGCGVASFGASLMDYDILTVSIAPRDVHEAQVQFALERGVPALLGVLSTYRLPFPSRCFDMIHCSRCLVQWTDYGGLYLMEIDRLLRPGGYWVLSGPPIGWKISYKGWERKASDLEMEQKKLEDLARRLCWKKIRESGPIAVWQKPTNHLHCASKLKTWKAPKFCVDDYPDHGWYMKMEACITPLPKVEHIRHTSGGSLEKWPKRLKTVPPRIRSATIEGITTKTFDEDNQLWKRRVSYYGSVLKYLNRGRYRNIMDMNSGLGGFAAALSQYPVWVMNVVPYHAKNNTLGIVYERGLVGTYMNWCEPFSTYPRTYDLIHADGLFSMYMDKCEILDILFEMYRILRPEGAIIIRDHVDVIVKITKVTDRMKWNSKISHNEISSFHPEKILFIDNSQQ
ncbi:probable methyltransferase PMT19 [Coffea eugenioides]|uniref:probable methyltransferase PMT19 n=1 Tax=Coffea eugenioides TaxID=49369 RepID=UPI000F610D69|nr:probable methyltransferase PMT19 [Coffea eugenioides]